VSEGVDALVVGAGVAGAASAYFLARAGLTVVLLDAEGPAAGASGQNPGFLWLQTKTPGPAMALGRYGRQRMQRLAEEIGDFGFRPCGGLILVRDEALLDVAHRFAADRRRAGLPVDWLDREETQDRLPAIGPDVRGALWCPEDAYQETHRLVPLLAAKARALGARLETGRPVAAVEVSGSRVAGVRLADGSRLEAPLVVVAAGPESPALVEPLGVSLPLQTIRFEAFATEPAPFLLGPVVCGQAVMRLLAWSPEDAAAVAAAYEGGETPPDGPGFTEQLAQAADGRLRGGCAFVEGTRDARPSLAGLGLAGSILPRNLPAAAALAVERIWAAIVAAPADGLPVIDAAAGPEGLILNCGHFFGNLAGVPSGEAVAALALGRPPPFDTTSLAASRLNAQP